MTKLPEPPRPFAVSADLTLLHAGAKLWRIYFAQGAHPVAWNDFRYFGPTHGRFDHHEPPARVQERGILYAADDPVTCLAEVFQVTRVIERAPNAPWLVAFALTREVPLLDLTGVWPTRAGASMAISSGPRPRARRWSHAIYDAYPKVEGLLYSSSMHANEPCVALYERARSSMPAAPLFHRALADPALLPRINDAARRLGYGLV